MADLELPDIPDVVFAELQSLARRSDLSVEDYAKDVICDAIRQIGVVEQTYYRWKKKYGGMGTDQLKELKRLQKENERLRKAVSDLTLDKLILTEASTGNY